VHLRRRIGMEAVQTVLLPECSPERVKELNYLSPGELTAALPAHRDAGGTRPVGKANVPVCRV